MPPTAPGATVLEVATADGLPTLRAVQHADGVAVDRLDPVGARWLRLSRHDTVDAALARLVATIDAAGALLADIDSASLGAPAAVVLLASVLDPAGVHVDGVRWSRRDVGGTPRWLPAWPAPGLWHELEQHEREWQAPRGAVAWQREVIARHGDVYVNVTVGDVREAFLVAGAFADEHAGVTAARALGLGLGLGLHPPGTTRPAAG